MFDWGREVSFVHILLSEGLETKGISNCDSTLIILFIQ